LDFNFSIFKMEIKKLRSYLRLLLKNHQKNLNTQQEPLKSIINEIRTFYKNGGHNMITKEIKRMPKPTEININTIGCFLFGSSYKNYGAVEKHDSPLYLQSLDSNDLSSRQIWVVNQTEAVWINEGVRYKNAYFFVNPEFKKFNSKDYNKIKAAGITSCNFFSTKNSKHYPREDLTLLNALSDATTTNKSKNINKIMKKDTYTSVGVFVFIILLILIIGYYIFNKNKLKR
jgi:hypothetical protein